MPRSKVALFIDAENLTKWIKDSGPEDLLSDLSVTGQVITRRAYGVWSQQGLISLQAPLNQLGFELIHCFHPVSGKNSTDIQMTVDVMEHALRLTDVEWFVLATGDSDFSPLFRRLREMGKEVIGVGPRSPLSESVKTSCSRYLYTDHMKEERQQDVSSQSISVREDSANSHDVASDYDVAADLVERILEAKSEPMLLGVLKIAMLNANPSFNEKNLGHSSFLNFVNSIDSIKTSRPGAQGDWIAELLPEEQQPPVDDDGVLQDGSVEKYTNLLRKTQWRQIPKSTLIKLQDRLKMAPADLDKNGVVDFLIKELSMERNPISPTEVRKGLTLFVKTGLFKLDDSKSGKWIYEYKADYRHRIDGAMLSRLYSACRKHQTKFDLEIAKALLYGSYKTEAQLRRLYDQAVEQAVEYES